MSDSRARPPVAIVALLVATAACGSPAEVKFDFPRQQIVIPVRVAGDDQACLLDTGTSPSAVDAALAAQVGLPMTGPSGKADGVGAEEVTVRATTLEVAVGGEPPARIDALAIDLGPLSRRIGRPIGCILGQSWLTTRVVQIDYPRRRVRVADRGIDPELRGRCESFPMTYWVPDDAMPIVEVKVQGVSYRVTLDTGSSGTLRLFERPAGVKSDPSERRSVAGIRGEATVSTAKVGTLAFGPIALENVEITLGDRNEGEPPGARHGNLGNGALQQSVLTLDYPSRRITVCAGGSP